MQTTNNFTNDIAAWIIARAADQAANAGEMLNAVREQLTCWVRTNPVASPRQIDAIKGRLAVLGYAA